MSPLGRGLASLIPRRRKEEAAELIDDIDTTQSPAPLEEVPAEPAEEEATPAEPESTSKRLPVQAEEPNEFEELANDNERIPMPAKPNVTPLTFDETSGQYVAASEFAKPLAREKAIEEKVVEKAAEKPAPKAQKSATRPVEAAEDSPEINDKWLERRVLGENVKYLPLTDIEVNPEQPRRAFEETELNELMQSLEQHGMLQPMVVMEKVGETGYQIIAGERRWRAAKQLGWTEVPCVVRSGVTGDKNRLELALTENVQRENLNPVEEAMGYKRLNQEYGMSHEEIGERVGKSRVAITNIIRILQLPAPIQKGLIEDKITVGHARAILMIPDEEKQIRFYEHVVDEGLTVRKTEIRARNIQRSMNVKNIRASAPPARAEFANQYDAPLQNLYGYNAKVKFNAPRNRFEVRFYAHSEKEIDELVNMLLRRKELPKNVDADVLED
jgi:ParB family transcriptional regulator, chromosome partitioning protein